MLGYVVTHTWHAPCGDAGRHAYGVVIKKNIKDFPGGPMDQNPQWIRTHGTQV